MVKPKHDTRILCKSASDHNNRNNKKLLKKMENVDTQAICVCVCVCVWGGGD